MKKIDYIIVGQGIAGTLLSWFLLNRGKQILVIDQVNPSSSSYVAAGIFNPITGRRFVKTWMADSIFPFAEKTYRQMEKDLDCLCYFPKPIIRSISGDIEKREWGRKSKRPEYFQYLNQLDGAGDSESVEILKGGFVDFTILLQAFREKLRSKNLVEEILFDFHDLVLGREEVVWKDYTAKKIIFCEGYHVLNNPFFKMLPFTNAKGEVLTIRTEAISEDKIISKGIFILPIGDHHFRVGATYNWDDRTETITEAAKQELLEKLDKIIGNNFELIDHKAGIRPTVKDRRPVIGLHHEHASIGIFNGMGSKGASLAPYLASQFVDSLEKGSPLDKEVDIKRFV